MTGKNTVVAILVYLILEIYNYCTALFPLIGLQFYSFLIWKVFSHVSSLSTFMNTLFSRQGRSNYWEFKWLTPFELMGARPLLLHSNTLILCVFVGNCRFLLVIRWLCSCRKSFWSFIFIETLNITASYLISTDSSLQVADEKKRQRRCRDVS